jgi:putative transcriptional regulator
MLSCFLVITSTLLDIATRNVYRCTAVKNRIRVLRAERSWSQGRLAELLQVSRQTVNAIETGRYDPSLPLAFRIARLFGRSIEGVFEPEEDFAQGDGAR